VSGWLLALPMCALCSPPCTSRCCAAVQRQDDAAKRQGYFRAYFWAVTTASLQPVHVLVLSLGVPFEVAATGGAAAAAEATAAGAGAAAAPGHLPVPAANEASASAESCCGGAAWQGAAGRVENAGPLRPLARLHSPHLHGRLQVHWYADCCHYARQERAALPLALWAGHPRAVHRPAAHCC
jgi:hypothetical protein